MKKLLLLLFLLVATPVFAKTYVMKYIRIGDEVRIRILCIDGYKWLLTYSPYSDYHTRAEQMFEKDSDGKTVPGTCSQSSSGY